MGKRGGHGKRSSRFNRGIEGARMRRSGVGGETGRNLSKQWTPLTVAKPKRAQNPITHHWHWECHQVNGGTWRGLWVETGVCLRIMVTKKGASHEYAGLMPGKETGGSSQRMVAGRRGKERPETVERVDRDLSTGRNLLAGEGSEGGACN